MSRKIWCNICFSNDIAIDMKLMDGYLICPVCGNESWPDKEGRFVDALKQQRRMEKQRAGATYVSLSLPQGVKIRGGSDPSGTTPDAGKKKTSQQLYKQLFKET